MKPPLSEKLITRLKNHRLVAVMIFVGTIIISLSAFTDAFIKLRELFPKSSPALSAEDARIKLAGMSVPYTPEEFVERAAAGDLTLVKLFLAAGMNPNTILYDGQGPTALFLAARENHPDVVRTLLKAGAKVINHESNAVEGAAQSGNVDILNLLLKTPVARDKVNQAFIMGKNRAVLEILLAHGADVKETGAEALLNASDPEAVAFLMAHGADINAKDAEGRSLVQRLNHDTVNLDTLQILIDRGANLNEPDKSGWTLLTRYAQKGYVRGLEMLIAKGVNKETTNPEGRTALSLACDLKYGNGLDAVRILVESGADVNAKDHTGKTPLNYARRSANPAVIQLLLAKGAKE